GDRWQLSLILTVMAQFAFDRGDDARALGPLRQALRLARDIASGERMEYAVTLAAEILHHRGRAREVATLVGAVEAVGLRRDRIGGQLQPLSLDPSFEAFASAVSAGLDEHRVAGRSLSLERAADLALRVIDEELALAATAGAGDSEATGEAPSIRSRGGRSQAFRER